MRVKIFPSAYVRLDEIWLYTIKKWGVQQAEAYLESLTDTIRDLPQLKKKWKRLKDDRLVRLYFIKHRHHLIFFTQFETETLGVISVLHENMDIIARLADDLENLD